MVPTSDIPPTDRDPLELEQLRRDQARLQDLGENLPGAMFQYLLKPDRTDAIAYMSPGSMALWGVTPQEAQDDPSYRHSVIRFAP